MSELTNIYLLVQGSSPNYTTETGTSYGYGYGFIKYLKYIRQNMLYCYTEVYSVHTPCDVVY